MLALLYLGLMVYIFIDVSNNIKDNNKKRK